MGLSYVNGAQAGPVLLLVASELPLPRHSHVWAWEEDLQDEAGTHVDAQLLDAGSEQPLQCLRGREAKKRRVRGTTWSMRLGNGKKKPRGGLAPQLSAT